CSKKVYPSSPKDENDRFRRISSMLSIDGAIMELRHLRYFTGLAGSLNFTRAAERLHVTQSTLSHQIRQLEDEIGQRKIDRHGKLVMLTETGQSFLAYASQSLTVIDQGLSELKLATLPLTGIVSNVTTYTLNMDKLTDCIELFVKDNPTVRVVME